MVVPVHTRCTEWSGFLAGDFMYVWSVFVIAKRVLIRSRATSNRLRAYGKSCRLVRACSCNPVELAARSSRIPAADRAARPRPSAQVCACALGMADLASDLSGNEGNNKQNADAVNRHGPRQCFSHECNTALIILSPIIPCGQV